VGLDGATGATGTFSGTLTANIDANGYSIINAASVIGTQIGNATTYLYGDGSNITNVSGTGGGVIQSNTAPGSPTSSTLWWDEVSGRLYIWYTDGSGSQWVDAAPGGSGGGSGSIIQSNTAPTSPTSSTLWYDEVSGRLYVWYTDGSGSQWVDAAPAGIGATGATGVTGATGANGSNGATGATGAFSGNLTANINGQGYSISNVAVISATGNITGNYILGNGSQLTGLPATYGNSNVSTFLAAYGSNSISTTGNITAGNLVGNISITGNVTGTSSNVQLVAGAYTWTFDNTGNLTVPAGGDILLANTQSVISAAGNITGNYILGNGSQLTGLPATYGNSNVATFLAAYGSNTISTSGNITAGNFVGNGAALTNVTVSIAGNVVGPQANVGIVAGSYTWTFDNTGNLTIPAAGDIILSNAQSTISAVGNITAGQFIGNGSSLTSVATQSSGSWTLTPGTNTVNFSVTGGYTYSMWVTGNIPNGIIVWNATGTVTNTNVPVIGQQFGWYYAAGNALVLTSIPSQIIGTAGSISNASPAVANTNVFTFSITNNSGSNQTVYYGWTKIG